VALAHNGGEIEIWGDGEQTRSFMYVDDCVEGLTRIMASDCRDALNLGTDELVTINGLVDMVSEAAGKRLVKRHNLTGPQGVRGRNSDNTMLRRVLGWEPKIHLQQGLSVTYKWIASQVTKKPVEQPELVSAR
jgi:nucleoside-diphosphate-sugar epimerase